jgi:hypothetical protein
MEVLTRTLIDAPWILCLALVAQLQMASANTRKVQPAPVDLWEPVASAIRGARASLHTVARSVGGEALQSAGRSKDTDEPKLVPVTPAFVLSGARELHSEAHRLATYVGKNQAELFVYGNERLRFSRGSALLDEVASRPALDEVCAKARRRAQEARQTRCPVLVELEGHACLLPLKGQGLYGNVALSSMRAIAVAEQVHSCLVEAGFHDGDEFLLTVRGGGSWFPETGTIFDEQNQLEATMARNRRVAVRFVHSQVCHSTAAKGEPR